MAAKKDYYEILGVPRTADAKELKAAYRKLARKYHPDVNPGNKAAEEKFKEAAGAFAVLSDPEKKAKYDQGGHEAFGPGFDPFGGVEFDLRNFGDLSDLFDLFGGGTRKGRSSRARRGADVQYEVRIPFLDAILGTTLEVPLSAEKVKVRIPEGIADGDRVRVPGKGAPVRGGGTPGDAYLVLRVEPHPLFRREGNDLIVETPVGLAKAALGGTLEVPTPTGKTTISLPSGTRSGQKMRLRGKGVPGSGEREAGDLYAVIQIVPPKQLDPRSRELLEEFSRLNPSP